VPRDPRAVASRRARDSCSSNNSPLQHSDTACTHYQLHSLLSAVNVTLAALSQN